MNKKFVNEKNDPELRKIRPKLGFPGGMSGKESAPNAGDTDPWDGKIPWKRIPFQYSCLEIPMERGALRATVHAVADIWTQLSD